MISFFTSLKPFHGITAVQQRNALRSWRSSNPGGEIIVFGAVQAGADALAEVSATYRPDIACNDFGTPLISAMFAQAQRIARHSILCFINGDIILLPDFATAVARLAGWRTFAAAGQRRDIDWETPIDFARTDWTEELLAAVEVRGRLRDPAYMDFFVFRRGAIGSLPPFAIGRPAWDNYLIMHLLRRRVPIVDLSLAVAALHQNHGYTHIPQWRGKMWEGPEAERNLAFAAEHFRGFKPLHYSIRNAQWIMLDRHVVPAISPPRIWWRSLTVIPGPIRHRARVGLLRRFRTLYRSILRFLFLRPSTPPNTDLDRHATRKSGGRSQQAPSMPTVVPTARYESDPALRALTSMRSSLFWKALEMTVGIVVRKTRGLGPRAVIRSRRNM